MKVRKKIVYHNQALAHSKQLLSPHHPTGNLDPLRRLNTETMPITNPLGLPDAHQLCHREATRPWDGTKISHPKILQSYLPYAPCMVMELWNSYHNSYQVTFDFLQVNILYNRHFYGPGEDKCEDKKEPFFKSSEIRRYLLLKIIHRALDFLHQTMGPWVKIHENRTFGEVFFFGGGSVVMYV